MNYVSKKCVALIPHADDELIGLNSLILDSDIQLIYFGYLGSDYSKDNAITRFEEFRAYCKATNNNYALYGSEGLKGLNEADIVFLPSIVDWHDEHRKLNYILRDYCNSHSLTPLIVMYNISVYSDFGKYAKYAPQTKQQNREKYDLFRHVYKSQHYLPITRFRIKERLYGKEISSFAAEKFISLDYSKWIEAIEIFDRCRLEREASELKNLLNDFQKLNEASTSIYIKILGSERT